MRATCFDRRRPGYRVRFMAVVHRSSSSRVSASNCPVSARSTADCLRRCPAVRRSSATASLVWGWDGSDRSDVMDDDESNIAAIIPTLQADDNSPEEGSEMRGAP
jgi:hypothetical protein